MKKIIISILLIVLACFFVNAAIIPRGDSIEVRNTGNWDLNTAEGYFVNQNPDPADPGSYVELRFKIENIGAGYAKDVVFELIPEYPFSLDFSVPAIRRIGDMYMNQVGEDAYILYYKVRVDKNAVDGNNPIKLRYSSDDGITWSRIEYYVRIQTRNPFLSISSVGTNPEEIAPGQKARLTMELQNEASSLIKDIKISLDVVTKSVTTTTVTTTELPLTPLGSANEKMLENLGPYEAKNLTFDLIVDPDAQSKVYKLPITLSYSDALGTNHTQSYYTSLIVGETPDLTITMEKSEIVFSGTSGTISIRFTNKGSSILNCFMQNFCKVIIMI
jgi:hypothetical protein